MTYPDDYGAGDFESHRDPWFAVKQDQPFPKVGDKVSWLESEGEIVVSTILTVASSPKLSEPNGWVSDWGPNGEQGSINCPASYLVLKDDEWWVKR